MLSCANSVLFKDWSQIQMKFECCLKWLCSINPLLRERNYKNRRKDSFDFGLSDFKLPWVLVIDQPQNNTSIASAIRGSQKQFINIHKIKSLSGRRPCFMAAVTESYMKWFPRVTQKVFGGARYQIQIVWLPGCSWTKSSLFSGNLEIGMEILFYKIFCTSWFFTV